MGIPRRLHVVPAEAIPIPPTVLLDVAEGIGGTQDEDLLCGRCDSFVALNLRPETLFAKFANARQVLIKCPTCGAHNDVPATVLRNK